MTRRKYFELCMRQDTAWLRGCLRNPSIYMRPRHVALIRLALRKKVGK